MRNRLGMTATRVAGASLCLWGVACAGAGHEAAAPVAAPHAQTANPAARKCLEDGYALQPMLGSDGLPVDHECVDRASGKRCEVWEYFRHECRLRDAEQR